jgi:acetyl esterase/lipase
MSPSTVSGRSLSLCFLIPIFGLGAGIVSASAAERMPFAEHQANLATNQANLAPNQATLAANQVTLTSNQVYVPGSRNRLQRLDIYAPAAQVKPQPPTEPPAQLGAKPPANLAKPATRLPVKLPVIVYIHGGSFCLGDKVTSVGAMPQVFTGKGFVFVSIDYRLSPAAHFPAHVQDVASAITWVHSSIARFGGDPNKIFLLGHSAGAQLAALVSCDERYLRRQGLGLKTVSGVVLLDGGAFDVTAALLTDKRRPIHSPTFGSNPATWRQASPVSHVQAGKNIPPFLIYYLPLTLQSTEQNSKLIRALRQARVPVDVHVIENKNHRQINEDLGNPDDPEGEQIARFFHGLFKGL